MKRIELKNLLKEALREVIREEMKDEGIKSFFTERTQSRIQPKTQLTRQTQPPINPNLSPIQQLMEETKRELTNKDIKNFLGGDEIVEFEGVAITPDNPMLSLLNKDFSHHL